MTAFNIVRFRVKPGREEEFLAAHRMAERFFPGMRRFTMVKTGDRAYCVLAEWASFDKIVAARPSMISILDSFRDTLEELPPAKKAAKKRKAAKKPARKAAKKTAKKTAKKKKSRRR